MTPDISTHLQDLRDAAARLLAPAVEEARARRLVFRNRKTGRHYARREQVEELAEAIKDFMIEEQLK